LSASSFTRYLIRGDTIENTQSKGGPGDRQSRVTRRVNLYFGPFPSHLCDQTSV
jgi:hypothetical protein